VSLFTRSYLLEAHPVSFANNLFTIGFDPQFEDHIALVDNSKNHSLLQTSFLELGLPGVQIKFVKAEAPARPKADIAAANPAPASQPKSSPAAQPARAATPAPTPAKEKPAPVAFNKEEFKNDPLIQKALEVFKGQIVEVRA
jgi:DNA polymerase-3 subunit gamma/tau